jgi:hypothetical protein|tara:strand:+ start:243 stop:437 length:195 start_codon:yes stop_codon:yes gene_type:complete
MDEEKKSGAHKYNDVMRKKAEADHSWGYYSRLVENYPDHKEEIGHTSHIAKEYPNWIRRSKDAF